MADSTFPVRYPIAASHFCALVKIQLPRVLLEKLCIQPSTNNRARVASFIVVVIHLNREKKNENDTLPNRSKNRYA